MIPLRKPAPGVVWFDVGHGRAYGSSRYGGGSSDGAPYVLWLWDGVLRLDGPHAATGRNARGHAEAFPDSDWYGCCYGRFDPRQRRLSLMPATRGETPRAVPGVLLGALARAFPDATEAVVFGYGSGSRE